MAGRVAALRSHKSSHGHTRVARYELCMMGGATAGGTATGVSILLADVHYRASFRFLTE